jgi:uncharacterized protein (DUF427 family)
VSKTQEHPHSIEIVNGEGQVRVARDGVVLAETSRAVLLHEGKLPTRYYIPEEDVRMDLLERTDSRTHCPFKGDASYWSARVRDELVTDLAWTYREPIAEAEKIAGLVCFYNEKVDIDVDGKRLERPKTHWS